MESVEHDGRTTAYRKTTRSAGSAEGRATERAGKGERDGEAATVLYVQGSGATHRAWARQYAPAGPIHPAVAVDLSGHGDSDAIGTDMLFHDADPEDLARSKDEMRAVGQRATRRDFLTCHQFDVRDRLGSVHVPTLAICGAHDQLTPPAYHESLAGNVQHGEFETIDAAAHLVMVERPEKFNDRLAGFLESNIQ